MINSPNNFWDELYPYCSELMNHFKAEILGESTNSSRISGKYEP